jgi:ribokinase
MIVVVGSVNLDILATVAARPEPGETVMALDHTTAHGGKGANQAVAAARLGADVHLIARVGDDAVGSELVDALAHEGVGVESVVPVGGPSGMAVIIIDARGENSIVVGAGANHLLELSVQDRALIAAADVVVSQLEIPMETVSEVASHTTGRFILNAAPSMVVPRSVLDRTDILVVNEHELTAMGGGVDPDSIRALGIPHVVTTLGARGATVVTRSDVGYIPALEVPVVDTTGAGDTVCGVLAAGIDAGEDVFSATSHAVVAGSLATKRVGARTGMPTREQLERAITRET